MVPNLARFLAEIKRDDLWSYAASAEAAQTMWQADLTGGVALVFGAEGKGVRPLVRKTCDAAISIPLAAGVESLNVSVAAAVLLYEAVAGQRESDACRSRRSTCSTATTFSTRAGTQTCASSPTSSRASSHSRARAGSSSSTVSARSSTVGPLSVRYAPDADTLLERLAAEHRHGERVCLVSSDVAVRGTSGQEVSKIASSTFLHELERPTHVEDEASRLRDRIDPETRAKLERLRRGE